MGIRGSISGLRGPPSSVLVLSSVLLLHLTGTFWCFTLSLVTHCANFDCISYVSALGRAFRFSLFAVRLGTALSSACLGVSPRWNLGSSSAHEPFSYSERSPGEEWVRASVTTNNRVKLNFQPLLYTFAIAGHFVTTCFQNASCFMQQLFVQCFDEALLYGSLCSLDCHVFGDVARGRRNTPTSVALKIRPGNWNPLGWCKWIRWYSNYKFVCGGTDPPLKRMPHHVCVCVCV